MSDNQPDPNSPTTSMDAIIDVEPTEEFAVIPADLPFGMFTSISNALPPIDVSPTDEFEAMANLYPPMSLISDQPIAPAGES